MITTDQQEWISDFVNQRGAFADLENLEYLDRSDLASMKFYIKAAEDIYQESKHAKTELDRERLMRIAFSHLEKVDRLLAKYGKDVGIKMNEKTDDERAEELLSFLS